MGRKKARSLIAGKRVSVDGQSATDNLLDVDRFMSVEIDGCPIQAAERALYVMLHKPVGVVSATKDAGHETVIDLIDDPDRSTLHLVGRLDRNTSGLLLLTNDGRWSKALMDPVRKVPKIYHVTTIDPIRADAVEAFANGFYFHTEDLTTMPAKLEVINETEARVTLHEGRYHQIKRMFHRIGNRVVSLHREQVADLALPADLMPGQWREISRSQAWSMAGI